MMQQEVFYIELSLPQAVALTSHLPKHYSFRPLSREIKRLRSKNNLEVKPKAETSRCQQKSGADETGSFVKNIEQFISPLNAINLPKTVEDPTKQNFECKETKSSLIIMDDKPCPVQTIMSQEKQDSLRLSKLHPSLDAEQSIRQRLQLRKYKLDKSFMPDNYKHSCLSDRPIERKEKADQSTIQGQFNSDVSLVLEEGYRAKTKENVSYSIAIDRLKSQLQLQSTLKSKEGSQRRKPIHKKEKRVLQSSEFPAGQPCMQTKREEKGYFTSEINVEKKSESATWSVLGENLEGKMVKVAEIAGDNHKAKGHFPNGDNLKTRQTMNVLQREALFSRIMQLSQQELEEMLRLVFKLPEMPQEFEIDVAKMDPSQLQMLKQYATSKANLLAV